MRASPPAPHGLQVVTQGRHRLVAVLGLLGQGPVEDGLQGGRNAGVELDGRAGRLVDDGVQDLDGIAAAERSLAGQHLVEDDAQAEDVGSMVDARALGLLGRAVAHRAVGHAHLRRRFLRALGGVAAVVRLQHLGQAEVEHLRLPPGLHDDVRGLDVAVDDAARMGHGQPVGDLDRDRERARHVERPSAHELAKGGPLDVLHDDVRQAVGLTHVVDRAYVGVVEGGAQAGLALEPPPRPFAAGEVGIEDLDHDRPAQTRVFGFVGGALPAASQLLQDPVVGEKAPGFQGGHGRV
jgi:hypothetical protein